jgi:hypothetical protein
MLQNFIRAERERAINLFRSPAQVRGSLLFKLGVEPSPQLGYGTGGGSSTNTPGYIGKSPSALIGDRMLARMQEKKAGEAGAFGSALQRTNSLSPNMTAAAADRASAKKKKKKKKKNKGDEFDLV